MANLKVEQGSFNAEISSISSSGTTLSGVSDGIKEVPSDVTTETPKKIMEAYSNLSTLLSSYGNLVVNDAKRIQVVGDNKVTIDGLAATGS